MLLERGTNLFECGQALIKKQKKMRKGVNGGGGGGGGRDEAMSSDTDYVLSLSLLH